MNLAAKNLENSMFCRKIPAILVLCCLIAVSASCLGKEKRPGDRDYPEINASPIDKIPITGTLPEGWSLRLELTYEPAKLDSHAILPGPDCAYDASGGLEGALFPYQVFVSLPVSRKGTEFSAEMQLDHFKPGRCEWHASQLIGSVSTANGLTGKAGLARSPIRMASPDPFAHTNVINLWCWKSAPPWADRGFGCNDGLSRSALASMKDIPIALQGNFRELAVPPILPTRETPRAYRFIFHDLDAEAQKYKP
jgi:hypothetical protein